MSRQPILALLLVPLLTSLACLSAAGSSATKTPATAGTASALTVTPAPQTTAEAPLATPASLATQTSPAVDQVTVQGDIVLGPGPFRFPEPEAGLAHLSSYQATLKVSFAGTQAGQPSQWSTTYVMFSVAEPRARQLTITGVGQVAETYPVFRAEQDGAAYEQRGSSPCTAAALDSADSLAATMEPASLLTGVIGAAEAGSETVNGVAANHYTFDERALGQFGAAKSTGELWVATSGDYLVKYRLTTIATADYFGPGLEGTATWEYDLTGANQSLALALPAGCPAGMLDAPHLPDAADLQNVPGLISYTTRSTPAEAIAFYQGALPALGWQPAGDPTIDKTLAYQNFTRSGQQLSLVITISADSTEVLISLAPIQP